MVGFFFVKLGSEVQILTMHHFHLLFFISLKPNPTSETHKFNELMSSINNPHRPQLIEDCNLLNGLPIGLLGEGKIVGPDKAQVYFGQPSGATGSQKIRRFVRFDGSTDGSSDSKPFLAQRLNWTESVSSRQLNRLNQPVRSDF